MRRTIYTPGPRGLPRHDPGLHRDRGRARLRRVVRRRAWRRASSTTSSASWASSASRCPRSTAARAWTRSSIQAIIDRGAVARAGVASAAPACTSRCACPTSRRSRTEEQKQRWLPGFVTGEMMFAIAMTEPGTGSDLAGHEDHRQAVRRRHALRPQRRQDVHHRRRARRPGDRLRPHRTAPTTTTAASASRCWSSTPSPTGYSVGRKLDKLGLRTSDTAELSFTDVKVPVEDLLGEEDKGFSYLGQNLPQERLGIAVGAYAQAKAAVRFAKRIHRSSARCSASRSPRSRTPSSSWPPARPTSTPPRPSSTARWRRTTPAS